MRGYSLPSQHTFPDTCIIRRGLTLYTFTYKGYPRTSVADSRDGSLRFLRLPDYTFNSNTISMTFLNFNQFLTMDYFPLLQKMTQRKRATMAVVLMFTSLLCIAQKKPTIMILPSDNWCTMRYFITTYDNQGTKMKVPNYEQAFQEDTELGQVISKVGGLLTDLGYSIKDAEQELRAMKQRNAEDNITISKNAGSVLAESPLDQLKKRVKADILIQIWWKVNKETNGKSVSFTLEAFDSYTNKRIGTSTGTGAASDEIIPVLLEQAVKANIEDFDKQMLAFYSDVNKNGREIVVNIKKWDDWTEDLESEFDGEMLLDIIENWMHDNTINDSFNISDATENFALFEQVRIPLVNDSGKSIDARSFISGLQRHLKNKYGIPAKLMIRGLGEANLILGEQ